MTEILNIHLWTVQEIKVRMVELNITKNERNLLIKSKEREYLCVTEKKTHQNTKRQCRKPIREALKIKNIGRYCYLKPKTKKQISNLVTKQSEARKRFSLLEAQLFN